MAHEQFPSWRYGPKGEAEIFNSEDEVPTGWHDHPSKHEKAEKEPKNPDAKKPPLDL